MADVRRRLEAFDPEHMYNMDESDLFYMAVPNRSLVPTKDGRRVRGSKSMKAKQHVMLVLAVDAAGTHANIRSHWLGEATALLPVFPLPPPLLLAKKIAE